MRARTLPRSYLPVDWKPGRRRRYPVIVEYGGNGPYRSQYGDYSSGMVEGGNIWVRHNRRKGIHLDLHAVRQQFGKAKSTLVGGVTSRLPSPIAKKRFTTPAKRYVGDPSAVVIAGS